MPTRPLRATARSIFDAPLALGAACGIVVLLACGAATAQDTSGTGHQRPPTSPGDLLDLDAFPQGPVVDLLLTFEGEHGQELRHRRSRDGGRTWSETRPVDLAGRNIHPAGRGAGPQVAASGDDVLVLFTRPGSGYLGAGPLSAAFSSDGGSTWRAAADPADDPGDAGHGFVDLAVDAEGTFHAVWLDGRDGAQGLRFASSADGNAWTANRTIDSRTCECCWNRLVTAAPGGPSELAVLYRDKDPRDMAIARSSDGRRWSGGEVVGRFAWDIDGCPHVGGGLARTGEADARQLVVTVWTGESEHVGVWLMRGTASEPSWAEPLRLGGVTARHSDVAAAGRTVWAIWDERPGDQGGTVVMAAVSRDGGATFAPPRMLSAQGVLATQPRVVATGTTALALWSVQRPDGTFDWSSQVLSADDPLPGSP